MKTRNGTISAGSGTVTPRELSPLLTQVLEAADELISAPSLDALYRLAVERARARVGLERCGLLLVDKNQMRGTYGTDRQGHTTDERGHTFDPVAAIGWSSHIKILREGGARWFYCQGDAHFEPLGDPGTMPGHGWVVLTPIRREGKLVAVFSNDAAISSAPCDPARQEALAVYCSLLGAIMERTQSCDQWRAVAGLAADYLWLVTPDGTFRHLGRCNTGHDNAEVSAFDLVHPEDHPCLRAALDAVLTGKEPLAECEMRFHEPGGALRWFTGRVGPLPEDGRTAGVTLLATDITDRKEAEQNVAVHEESLRSLASELTLTEERERRRISTELHDGVTQYLAMGQMRLAELRTASSSEQREEIVQSLGTLLSDAIQQTRTLTFELSPPVLYELGIEPALEWLTDHFEHKYGLSCSFISDNLPKPLDLEDRVFLFQSVREVLTNVVKHAHARTAVVSSRRQGSDIHIEVADDGAGFDPASTPPPSAHTGRFGLFNARERLEGLGGTLDICSQPGRGCRIHIGLPLQSIDDPSRT